MGNEKERPTTGILQGTLDMLVLKALARGPLHGYDVAEHILTWSGDVFAGGRRRTVSGAPPAGAAWAAGERVGRLGEQPPGEVLPVDGGGPEATGRGSVGVGQALRCE